MSRFIDMHDIGDALVRAGFTGPVLDVEHFVLTYDDVLGVMRDLKAIGAHNAAQGRPKGLEGRGFLARLTSRYEQFRAEDLYWIDLARHPTEPPERFQQSFADPRAAAALEAFRTRYRALRARRRAVQARPIDAATRGKLEGLGYAVPSDEAPRSPRHGFVLPPPGDARARAPH